MSLQPKVSIVVTAYLEASKPYLDLCVQSLMNLDYPKNLLEMIIVSPSSYAPQYEGICTISPQEASYGCPRGLNYGIEHASGELIFVLNDDVIVTRGCLNRLVGYFELQQLGLLMPIGNDQQGRYSFPLPILGPYKIEHTEGATSHMMNIDSPYPRGLMFHDTLCIYAYIMRKKAHDEIGGFDENLVCSDDIDFTLRLRQKGYVNAIATDALVWHAGGVSADHTFTQEMRERGQKLFNEKWGRA